MSLVVLQTRRVIEFAFCPKERSGKEEPARLPKGDEGEFAVIHKNRSRAEVPLWTLTSL